MNPELAQLLQEIKALPYGRNSDRANYLLVPTEQKGACSTKHAYVKHIALEKGWENVKLFLGIYMMSEQNTKGVGSVLQKFGLKAIPEAHVYLRINSEIIDITGLKESPEPFHKSLKTEVEIQPDQIGEFKIQFHKQFISEWVISKSHSPKEIWAIREECIRALSEKR